MRREFAINPLANLAWISQIELNSLNIWPSEMGRTLNRGPEHGKRKLVWFSCDLTFIALASDSLNCPTLGTLPLHPIYKPAVNLDFPDQTDFPEHTALWDAVNYKSGNLAPGCHVHNRQQHLHTLRLQISHYTLYIIGVETKCSNP